MTFNNAQKNNYINFIIWNIIIMINTISTKIIGSAFKVTYCIEIGEHDEKKK